MISTSAFVFLLTLFLLSVVIMAGMSVHMQRRASSGIGLIEEERWRMFDCCLTPEYDDFMDEGELVIAAMKILDRDAGDRKSDNYINNLITVGAMVARELERVGRVQKRERGGTESFGPGGYAQPSRPAGP